MDNERRDDEVIRWLRARASEGALPSWLAASLHQRGFGRVTLIRLFMKAFHLEHGDATAVGALPIFPDGPRTMSEVDAVLVGPIEAHRHLWDPRGKSA